MGEQPTAIELLDAENPGLRLAVDLMFDHHATLKQVQQMLAERYELKDSKLVPERTIANYRERRYRPAKARIEYLQEKTLAIVEIAKRVPEREIRDARIYEELDSLDPKTLLRARYDSARLDIERGKLAVAEKQADTERGKLELQVKQFERERAEIKEIVSEAQAAAAGGKPFDAGAAFRQISAVIGVGGAAEERIEPSVN